MWEATIQVEQSEAVRGEPSQLWALLSSPAGWSLWPDAPFMFAVAGAPALRLHIGPYRDRTASELVEVVDEVPGEMIRLRSLPTGRQQFTLAVAPGKRGTATASVRMVERVARQQKIDYEMKRRKFIKGWLWAMRAVIEGRTPWPGADMPATLLQACVAQPPFYHAHSASASAVIDADPVTVWDAVHSPETTRDQGPSSPIYCGYVPGTPEGKVGEMQYFVSRRNDDRLAGQVVVVTEVTPQRSAIARLLGPGELEQHYLLNPESESGPTRLELVSRWPVPRNADSAEAVRNHMAEGLQEQVTIYKSLIENATGPGLTTRH